jgi:uncharacterized protein (TIGR02246 family)
MRHLHLHRKHMWWIVMVLATVGIMLVFQIFIMAQDSPPPRQENAKPGVTKPTENKIEVPEVAKMIEAYTVAYNRGDAKALAECWRENGELITPNGEHIVGRAAIQKQFEAIFSAEKGAKLELLHLNVRRLTPDAAVEEGMARVTRPGKPTIDGAYVATHVRENGQWRLDNVRELEQSAPPSRREELRGLEGFIGSWIDRGQDSTIESKFLWTKNYNFIHHTFKITSPDTEDLEGVEIIGWDPNTQEIRSWIFDTDGSFGEGVWHQRGNHWVVKISSTLHDGRKTSATQIYRLADADTITWESLGRQVNGQRLPNVGPVNAVRVK